MNEKETIAALVKLYAEEESISEEVKQIKSDAKESGFNPSILSAVAKSIVKNNVDSLIEKSEDIIRVVEVSLEIKLNRIRPELTFSPDFLIMNKGSTEDFIQKTRLKHGTRYNYDLVCYSANSVKVPIVCEEHGVFYQTPAGHLRGKGCFICGAKSSISSRTLTTETFIEKAKEVHGAVYDYTLVNYLTMSKHVEIICKVHGAFLQAASNHLTGQGCPNCGNIKRGLTRRSNNSEFIAKALKLHNDQYDYSHVEYTTNFEKVLIRCQIHGLFYQSPAEHLSGSRCPSCANESKGWNRTAFREAVERNGKGTLYLVKIFDNEEVFLKLGITSHSVTHRFRSNIGKCYNYEVVYEVSSTDGDKIYNAEKQLLRKFSDFKYNPKIKFEGYTECFVETISSNIISEIKDILKGSE